MFRAAILCAILVLAKGQTTDVSQCTVSIPGWEERYPLPLNTYIRGCTVQPCLLPQGQDVVIDIVFIAPRTMQRMTTALTAFIGLVPIPYPLQDNAHTCNFLSNAQCPVTQNQIILYTLRFLIEDFIPFGTQMTLEFTVQDENDITFTCFRTQVRITAPRSKLKA